MATATILISRSSDSESRYELVDVAKSIHLKKGSHDVEKLQKSVYALMEEVRKAGRHAAIDAHKRDKLAMELAELPQSSSNPVKAAEDQDHLKEELSTQSASLEKAEKKRKALQRRLDKAVNDLAKAQLLAFNLKEASEPKVVPHSAIAPSHAAAKGGKPKSELAVLEGRAQALSDALGALKTLKSSAAVSGSQGELYLAELGQKLLGLPEVQKLLSQSLSAKDLEIAEQIAKSLGKNFSATDAVDPKIIAEVAIATAEQDAGVPLEADGKTHVVNASSLLPALSPELVAQAAQAAKEAEIEKKAKGSGR